jgi:predicted N-acetyltransferase YhbS
MSQQKQSMAEIELRLLLPSDGELLFQYLQQFETESISHVTPHPFDRKTVTEICEHLQEELIHRYVAVNTSKQEIIAYMIVKPGFSGEDAGRYYSKSLFFDNSTTCTFAPSVSKEWQNSGLGSAMFDYILNDLRKFGFKTIILWGGVQATNSRALHYYIKHGGK